KHSLQYILTRVTGLNFPEFTSVGQWDGDQIDYYDSNIRRVIPKTDWIQGRVGEDYWKRETQISRVNEEWFKANMPILMQRFNHTE
ncbi:MHC class I antigen, partial [Clarias magur]